jgi:RNA polymerase sigma-70 factor (ECF subfamily)
MSENSLIERCQRGKADAFEQLLALHYDTIYRFAYRWCGDQHNAQDITQLACITLARSINQFQHQSSFTSWLYRLVINCAKDFYKSPTQRNQREESEQDIDLTLGSSASGSNEQRVYAQQILEHINHLHEDLQDTLILVYGTGLSHLDAANALGVKESTISWRIHQARKLLKQKFTSPSLGIDQAETAGDTA